jgi:hypothetical protein
MTRVSRISILCAAACVWFAAPAWAQATYGVRAGASGQPNQFFIGGHAESSNLGHNTTFRPNVEVGFSSGMQLLTLNLELVHWMPLKGSAWSVYAGGGIGTNFLLTTKENRMTGRANIVFGLQHKSGIFAEMKVGTQPSAKVAVGYVFQ